MPWASRVRPYAERLAKLKARHEAPPHAAPVGERRTGPRAGTPDAEGEQDTQLSVRIPKAMKDAVRIEAVRLDATVQQYVTDALREHLARVRS